VLVTHLQLVRNPHINPLEIRVNARAFQQTVANLTDLQFGRELEEEEVLRINYVLKRRAARYIAAGNKEWLYPEKHLGKAEWAKLDADWFLFPNPWKVGFTSEIMMGFNDGSAWGIDEYGRTPTHPNFKEQERHDRDWSSFQNAKLEWARKRVGKSLAHVDDTMREDSAGDSLMNDYLRREGTDSSCIDMRSTAGGPAERLHPDAHEGGGWLALSMRLLTSDAGCPTHSRVSNVWETMARQRGEAPSDRIRPIVTSLGAWTRSGRIALLRPSGILPSQV